MKKKKKKLRLNKDEKAILKTLYDARRPISLLKIARENNMAWTTVRMYVMWLLERGFIKVNRTSITGTLRRRKLRRRKRYVFNYDVLEEEEKKKQMLWVTCSHPIWCGLLIGIILITHLLS